MITPRVEIAGGKKGKGRVFSASILYYIVCSRLLDAGSDTNRPVAFAFGATEQAARAVRANLRTGRQALVKEHTGDYYVEDRIDFKRKAGHRWYEQRGGGNMIVSGIYPGAFELDPLDMLTEDVRFVFAPPTWWVDANVGTFEAFEEADRREMVLAAYFAAFLDRRTAYPIINAPAFHLQLYRAAIARAPWMVAPRGRAKNPGPIWVYPEKAPGLEVVYLVDSPAASFEAFLRSETRTFYKEGGLTDGAVRIAGDRRLLPDSAPPAGQLSLAFMLPADVQ